MFRLLVLFEFYKERLSQCRAVAREHPDKGSFTTETVIVIAVLVAIAIAVGAVLMTKVMAKVNQLDLG